MLSELACVLRMRMATESKTRPLRMLGQWGSALMPSKPRLLESPGLQSGALVKAGLNVYLGWG